MQIRFFSFAEGLLLQFDPTLLRLYKFTNWSANMEIEAISAMDSSSPSPALAVSTMPLLILFLLLLGHFSPAESDSNSVKLTVSNGCNHDIWPAVQPDVGNPTLAGGGFQLNDRTNFLGCQRTIDLPSKEWSGRLWARTGCKGEGKDLKCKNGDCGKGLKCDPYQGGQPPFSVVQVAVANDTATYSVGMEGSCTCNLAAGVTAKSKDAGNLQKLSAAKCPMSQCDGSCCIPSQNAGSCSNPQVIAVTFCPDKDELDVSI